MPYRIKPIVTGNYYHIFNRGIDKRLIFQDVRDYRRFLEVAYYYQWPNTRLRYSMFKLLSKEAKFRLFEKMKDDSFTSVSLLCFALLPNHFHFIIKQSIDGGISKFMKNLSDSYTRYFNIKYKRLGPLFQGQFKAVHVDKEDQLLILSRYIHLNPLISAVVDSKANLYKYPWSSLPQYLHITDGICNITEIKKKFTSVEQFRKYLEDQKDYDSKMEGIKHLILE